MEQIAQQVDITNYTNFRQNLKAFLDQVFVKHAPLFVTRTNGEDVVVLSKSDYESMVETCYLLSSPKNAERIHQALKDLDEGKGLEKALIEE